MKSIRTLREKIGRKVQPILVQTLIAARKQRAWHPVAFRLARPTRQHPALTLRELEEKAKEGDTIIVPGKIVGTGTLTKHLHVCALSFSASALEKMKESKTTTARILDEIKKNPKAEGIKVLP